MNLLRGPGPAGGKPCGDLDADKEGFLWAECLLIQTIAEQLAGGRCYMPNMTDSTQGYLRNRDAGYPAIYNEKNGVVLRRRVRRRVIQS